MRPSLLAVSAVALICACASRNKPLSAGDDQPPSPPAAAELGPDGQRDATAAPPVSNPRDEAPCSDHPDELPPTLAATTPPAWLPGWQAPGACEIDARGVLRAEDVSRTGHEIGTSGGAPFDVSYHGPTGSGQHWWLAVSFLDGDTRSGFCFSTTTVGSRHVGGHQALATLLRPLLAWIQDPDGDGDQELVVRGSFALPGGGLSNHALTATAYDVTAGAMKLDRASTYHLRSEMAKAYEAAQQASSVAEDDRDHFRAAAEHLRTHACAPPDRAL